MQPILYLHGFASGPQSSKCIFFEEKCRVPGIPLLLPDLNGADFERLTITGQLAIIDTIVRERRPQAAIGSSLGGYLAALYAARHPGLVPRLVLLAPGFGFARRWPESLGQKVLEEWRERGYTQIYHYGWNRVCRLGYQLISDGQQYEDYPNVTDQALIIHGTRDETVNFRWSEEFARDKPNVMLQLIDADHQMLDALEPVWKLTEEFLRLPAAAPGQR